MTAVGGSGDEYEKMRVVPRWNRLLALMVWGGIALQPDLGTF